jgi:metal-responsive CopG/Arc/MetJ family transcriptional regulator
VDGSLLERLDEVQRARGLRGRSALVEAALLEYLERHLIEK